MRLLADFLPIVTRDLDKGVTICLHNLIHHGAVHKILLNIVFTVFFLTEMKVPLGMMDYYKKLGSGLLITGGAFLLLEHLFQFGGFDFFDFLGHEYYGLAMIGAGFLLSVKWKQLPSFIKAIKEKDIWKILDQGERK